jgi:hypothetical protein
MKPEDILINGGEMGTLIRAFDWSTTPLGSIIDWPFALFYLLDRNKKRIRLISCFRDRQYSHLRTRAKMQ